MKILFFAAGTDRLASSRTRVYQYLPYLKKAGVVFGVINFTSRDECRMNMMKTVKSFKQIILHKLYSTMQVVKLLFLAPFFNVVFVQKVLLPEPLQSLLKLLNRNLVFDFDDAIFISEIYQDNKFVQRFIAMLKISKCVLLENDFAYDFCAKYNRNITMITGPIDVNRYTLRNSGDNGKVVIGWIGSQDTVGYLLRLYPVLKRLALKHNIIFEIIGARNVSIDCVEVTMKDWSLETEVGNLHDFDIGIMPLNDDNWSRGKGGYKLLQYMAIGIPCVASPIGVNQKIIREDVNGYLASDEENWERKLGILIEDRALRSRMGASGRQIAVNEYSFEANIDKFIGALEKSSN